MNESIEAPGATPRRSALMIGMLVIVWLMCSTAVSIRSYRRSDSLTLADATLRTDEGLLSLQFPLVRLAREEKATTEWTTYRRKSGVPVWESENAQRITLRQSMSDRVKNDQDDAGMLLGFGYSFGDWQSPSRPGPFIEMFAPIWAATLALTLLAALFVAGRVRFRVRSALAATALTAALLWLLTLRASN